MLRIQNNILANGGFYIGVTHLNSLPVQAMILTNLTCYPDIKF